MDGFVFDERDAALSTAIGALGLETNHLDTLMVDAEIARAVADSALEIAERLR